MTKNEERQVDRDREGFIAIAEVLKNWNRDDGPATPNRLTGQLPFGKDRTRNLLDKMVYAGELESQAIEVRGNKTLDYFLPRSGSG